MEEILQKKTDTINTHIIVLTYNKLETNKLFFNNLFKYTNDFHLTIFDNGSTDGTKDFLKDLYDKKNNITLINSDCNTGIIEGRNKSYYLSKIECKYIIFLDNDQIVQEKWLDSHLDYMLSNNLDLVGVEAWQMRSTCYPYKKINNKDFFHYVGCGGMLIKKEVIETIGLFDKRFNPMYFEDPDFNWRAYQSGFKIGWNPNSLIKHIPHKLLSCDYRKKCFNDSLKKIQQKWKKPIIVEKC